jgi:mono/diheme cytochrome c family protein
MAYSLCAISRCSLLDGIPTIYWLVDDYFLRSNDTMTQYFKMALGLASIFFLLVGCQDPADESIPSMETPAEPIVPSLPALSEFVGTPAPAIPPLPTLDSGEIALGQNVYSENCAECHGNNLEGEADWQMPNDDNTFRPPPHDASGHTWHHSDRILFESIELGGARLPDNIGGTSNMPAFADTLTKIEITAVLTYIKSTWPEDIRAIQWEQTIRQ